MSEESIEHSAGVVLVVKIEDDYKALLIRVRREGFELPKGHVEPGETPEEAALRELREETGIENEVSIVQQIGDISYSFESKGAYIQKRVEYFLAVLSLGEEPEFGPPPKRTRELKWIQESDIHHVDLANDELRRIFVKAFDLILPG